MARQIGLIVVSVVSGLLLGWGESSLAWAQEEGTEEGTESSASVSEEAPLSTEPSTEPPTPDSSAVEPAPSDATPAVAGMISVDFKDADIRQVLRIISLKSGMDIVAGTDVEGLVTIKLTNVPWEQALDIILRTYGFTYERKERIIRVMTIEQLQNEALATEVFPLDYAKAKEVPDIINEMLSDRGRVKFDERTNTIIVTDIPTVLTQIKEVIERLDQRTPQVLIASRIVETKLTKEENLGINWSDSLTLTQTIPSISNSFPFRAGSGLGELGQIFAASRAPNRGDTTFTLGTLSSSSLQLVLNFLQSRTNTSILSNPSISVLDNQQAKIHIGQEYPIPNYSIDPTTGRTTISGYTPRPTGTVLTVTPHVNPSKEIVVDLKPEIVTADASGVTYDTGSGSSVTLPLFTTQTAQTQVRISDGETIAIGGLVKKSEQHSQEKIPVLGDLPLIGLLFRQNRWYSGGSDPNRQDLLIFLTVKLIEEGISSDQAIAAAMPDSSLYEPDR